MRRVQFHLQPLHCLLQQLQSIFQRPEATVKRPEPISRVYIGVCSKNCVRRCSRTSSPGACSCCCVGSSEFVYLCCHSLSGSCQDPAGDVRGVNRRIGFPVSATFHSLAFPGDSGCRARNNPVRENRPLRPGCRSVSVGAAGRGSLFSILAGKPQHPSTKGAV